MLCNNLVKKIDQQTTRLVGNICKQKIQLENGQKTWMDIPLKKDTQMASAHTKRCPMSLAVKETQVKTARRGYHTPRRMAKAGKNSYITKCQ